MNRNDSWVPGKCKSLLLAPEVTVYERSTLRWFRGTHHWKFSGFHFELRLSLRL